MDISELKFDESGLIPTIVAEARSGDILMLAYMSKDSLRISMEEGRTCFWSRSRNELWRKGETSGNVQHIIGIRTDCDKDTLLVTVNADGPACHTGANSCFYNEILTGETLSSEASVATGTKSPFTLTTLHNIIKDRKLNPKPGSYTTYLFEKGKDKILKKIGEESTEVIIAGKSEDKAEAIFEIADLVYHTFVLMTEMGIEPEDIINELSSRYKD